MNPTRRRCAGPRVLATALAFSASTVSQAARAERQDRAAALQHFKDALELKDASRCDRAIPLFQESARLDKQAKTLIQLADCEEAIGKWSDALRDWRDARDQASLGSDPVSVRQRQVAEQRMAELEAKLPRLTIVLAAHSPPDARVSRDGIELGSVSLNRALPVDPGPHRVRLEARDYEPREWEVTLNAGEHARLPVALTVRRRVRIQRPERRAAQPRAQIASPEPQSQTFGPQRVTGLVLGGAGLLSGAAAGALWLSARAKHEEALDYCRPECGAEAEARQEQAMNTVTLARLFGVGAAVLAGSGLVLFATAPTPQRPAPFALSPSLRSADAGLHVSGSW